MPSSRASRRTAASKDAEQQQRPAPSSADAGFFQEAPKLGNQFKEDIAFQRVLNLYLPQTLKESLYRDLTILGDKVVSPQVLRYLEDAERHPPELETHDAFARPSESLRTSEGWRKLSDMGAWEGCVAEAYSGQGRISQFARYYVFSPSSAIVTCPFAMTDGAARLLSRHLKATANRRSGVQSEVPTMSQEAREAEAARQVFKDAYGRLISRDPSERWTSGQWMTERPGGSDVSRSETTATYAPVSSTEQPVGPWAINGYKFFSSATDCDMTVLLARTDGSKNLSAFFAPMNRPDGTRNGARIVRLKKKLGTRALPTAELELKDMRAWMIGKEGEGVREIATILNITRVHNSVSAVSFMRRALNVAKAYARVRLVARGKPLYKNPLHLHTLAKLEVLTRAATHLSFLSVQLLNLSEARNGNVYHGEVRFAPGSAPTLLRIITPLSKAVTAKLSLAVISESVEALGGVGYLENEEPLNLARLLRDAQVLAIWEGTTNVLVTDLVNTITRTTPNLEENTLGVFSEWVRENLTHYNRRGSTNADDVLEQCKVSIWKEWEKIQKKIENRTREDLTSAGRKVMWQMSWVVIGVMLLVDARHDPEPSAVEIARRWVFEGFLHDRANSTKDQMKDTEIVFPNDVRRTKL